MNPTPSAPPLPAKTIRFIRRGQVVSLDNVPPERTLLEVLREDLGACGTKEGCGEGDCGACTVVLGQAEDGALRYRAINSCIRLAHSVDGMALWTAEDLTADPLIQPLTAAAAPPAPPAQHPVQEAMVQCHASQCGFCTPGFVMSLFGLYQTHVLKGSSITRPQAQEALSGNLCRCTGYRPILDAAQTMADLPPVRVDEAALLAQLAQLAQPEPPGSAPPVCGGLPASESATAAAPAPQTAWAYQSPRTLTGLLQLRAAHPNAQLVAGCTDVGLWITKQHRQFAQIIDLTQVQELRRIDAQPQHLMIGAAVTLADAFEALVNERPELHSFASRFAGLPVRNSGTLGGNVANGSPIGDSMPLLIALGACVVLASVRGERELPLENLYTGYRQNVMAPDEVLAWIKVPRAPALPAPETCAETQAQAASVSVSVSATAPAPEATAAVKSGEFLRVYKISKRYDDDISAICLALNLRLSGGLVEAASIGAGGVAATPVRAVKTEAALVGQPWTLETVQRAIAVLRAEFSPISDMRASAAYRTEVLGNLLQRYWLESQGQTHSNLASFVLEELA
jgi:xanthine dehydrogenase small subunit